MIVVSVAAASALWAAGASRLTVAATAGAALFVTDGIAAAVEQAKTAAGEKDVLIAGGLSVAQQALAAGLVDELALHVSPTLLGRGARLFDDIGTAGIPLRQLEVTASPSGVTHMRYEITA